MPLRGVLPRSCVLAAAWLGTLSLLTAGLAHAEPTPYPLEHEYRPAVLHEKGTVPGQLRLRGLVGAAFGGSRGDAARLSTSVSGQGVIEAMGTAWLGVRATGFASVPVPLAGDAPQLFSGRLGPSFHLFPFRVVDLGSYFDGGFALVDVFRDDRALAPVLGAGGTIDIALSPYLALHIEGGIQGGILDRGGQAETMWLASGVLGLGLMF